MMLRGALSIVMTTTLILGSVGAVGAVVGMTLPATHQAARSARFDAPPTKVFAVVSDVGRYAEWRTDVRKVDILSEDESGTRFAEHSSERTDVTTYRVVESVPPTRLKITVDDTSKPFGGSWTYVLLPFDGGTSLTITEEGEIGNPLFRVVARLLFSPTDAMDRYLHDLASIEGLGGRRR